MTTIDHCSEGTLGNRGHTKRALGLPGDFYCRSTGKLPTSKGVPSGLWYVSTYRTSHLPGFVTTRPDMCQGFLFPRVYQTSNVVSSPELVPCFYQGFSFLSLVLPGFSFFTRMVPVSLYRLLPGFSRVLPGIWQEIGERELDSWLTVPPRNE